MTEHSTPRERTHLFTAFFAVALVAGVAGSLLGGWLPRALAALPVLRGANLGETYRLTLAVGALISLSGAPVFARFRDDEERRASGPLFEPIPPPARRVLRPVAVNALLIGAGAGLVIPFMNLYFAERFRCSSAQIGSFFSMAQVLTAAAAMLGPALARRFGKLRTSVVAQLASLPFLVTLGIENQLGIAVAAFLARATLMQASTPLLNTFIMEALPAELRATATGMINLLWNIGWAVSATLAGAAIQRWGYGPTFATTATLYATAALYFYLSFRGSPESGEAPRLSEEVKGRRADGP
jgi:predicted MFS family arabinose efflux permease